MPTPRLGYYIDGKRVPSVTTIIPKWNIDPLMEWAAGLAREGKNWKDARSQAAGVGTVVHSMVERHLAGGSPEDIRAAAALDLNADDFKQALSGFDAYLDWQKGAGLRVLEQEIQLVSREHLFGGTPDAIGVMGNQLVMLDWKTSNSIRSGYLTQIAAYKALWEENRPDQPISGIHLLRFSKEHGDFAHRHYQNLDNAWEQFLCFRRAYEIEKELKKRAA